MPAQFLIRLPAGTALMAVLLTIPSGRTDPERRLPGFSLVSARTELQWEDQFRVVPNPDTLRESMRRLSARPHHVGSPYDKDNAEWILGRFKSFGLEAHIEQFDVLFPDSA